LPAHEWSRKAVNQKQRNAPGVSGPSWGKVLVVYVQAGTVAAGVAQGPHVRNRRCISVLVHGGLSLIAGV
jgi:hypothetical protein